MSKELLEIMRRHEEDLSLTPPASCNFDSGQWAARVVADKTALIRALSAMSEVATVRSDNLRSINPDIGAPTRECSLDQIVYRYYRAHFDHDEARTYTNDYFHALAKAMNSPPTDQEANESGVGIK